MTRFHQLADSILAGKPATADDALEVLRSGDDELLDVVAAAGRLRREHFGNTVKVNYLVNLKSGLCPEDCHYCSQALGSTADILKYIADPLDAHDRQAADAGPAETDAETAPSAGAPASRSRSTG